MSSFSTATHPTNNQISHPKKNQETPPGLFLINNKQNPRQKIVYSNK